MFEKKYTKVRIKDGGSAVDREIYVESIEDGYYGTQYFKITTTEGGEVLLNLDEIKEVASVAEEFTGQ